MRSHGAGLLEAEPSGERRLGNDGCSGPAAPFPEPPDQSPAPASRSPPPRAARPAPLRPPRTAPRRAPPAPRAPTGPRPRCEANKQRVPRRPPSSPADRSASSHLGRSRSEPALRGGTAQPRRSGATWRPPPPPGPRQAGGEGSGDASWDRGLKSLLCRRLRPGQLGKVGSPGRPPALAPARLPFFSSSRTWEPPGCPGSPWLRARNSAATAAAAGWAWDAPRAACSRRPRPRPTRRPAHFPCRRPTSPVAVPSRAGAAAPAGTHFVRAGAAAAPGERGVVGPERGAGARRGAPPSPSPALSAPRPRARRRSRRSWSPTFSSFPFLSNAAGNSCSVPAGGNALALPSAQTRSLLSPSPPTPAAQQKAIYMRGSDPRPPRAPPPPPAPRTQAKVGAPGGARAAGSGPAGDRAGGAALLPTAAPARLSPRPAHAQLPARNSARPRPGAVSCRRPSRGRRGSQRSPARSVARAAPPPRAVGNKTQSDSGVGSAAAAKG